MFCCSAGFFGTLAWRRALLLEQQTVLNLREAEWHAGTILEKWSIIKFPVLPVSANQPVVSKHFQSEEINHHGSKARCGDEAARGTRADTPRWTTGDASQKWKTFSHSFHQLQHRKKGRSITKLWSNWITNGRGMPGRKSGGRIIYEKTKEEFSEEKRAWLTMAWIGGNGWVSGWWGRYTEQKVFLRRNFLRKFHGKNIRSIQFKTKY